ALDVIDSQLVELARDEQLVVDGKADGLALRSVPERGVKREDLHIKPPVEQASGAGGLLHSCYGTPASFLFFTNVIMLRSSAPTVSIGCLPAASRMARKFFRPVLFSLIHVRANSPDWISERIFFISARVCSFTTRGPRV